MRRPKFGLRRDELVEGETYVTIYLGFARLEKKGILFHKLSRESNGREWIEYKPTSYLVMTAGEYYNRMYGTYGEDYED